MLVLLLLTPNINQTIASDGVTISKGIAAFESGDYKKALSIFRPLAEANDANAQFYMGWMYDEGNGVTENDQEALKWYEKSAKNGNESAEKAVMLLQDNLSKASSNKPSTQNQISQEVSNQPSIKSCSSHSCKAESGKSIIIKFSHVNAADTPKGRAAEHFAKLAYEKTQQRVKIEVYPNGTLYKNKDEIEALQRGLVQILAPPLIKFGQLGIKEFDVFDLPFIFDDYHQLHTVTEGPIGKSLLDKLAPKGILGLAFWDIGFKVMSANKPLREIEDFRDIKMRIQFSNVLESQMKALGAIPQIMVFSEVYQALEMGIVDGTENPPFNFFSEKMYEVQKYVTISNHGYMGYAVIVNKEFWEDLPTDIRKSLEEAMSEATKFANEISKHASDESIEKINESGQCEIIQLTHTQKKAWKKQLIKVHNEMKNHIGKDLINSIYKATGCDCGNL